MKNKHSKKDKIESELSAALIACRSLREKYIEQRKRVDELESEIKELKES